MPRRISITRYANAAASWWSAVARPSGVLVSLARELGAEACTSAPTSGRSHAHATSACRSALRQAGIEARVRIRGCSSPTTSTRSSTAPARPTPCSRRLHDLGAAGREGLSRPRRGRCRRFGPRASTPEPVPRARRARSCAKARRPDAGGRAGRPRADAAVHVSGRMPDTQPTRHTPGRDGVSRLSPYLHLGCVSARELEQLATAGVRVRRRFAGNCAGGTSTPTCCPLPRQYARRAPASVSWHARAAATPRRLFDAWRDGQTGYPLVDAGMRQLLPRGVDAQSHAASRGSFLTKDLGIDWRWGERWFMRLLLDGDEASNNGNWQWIASVGVDPQPASRRISSPVRQQARFDPDGHLRAPATYPSSRGP